MPYEADDILLEPDEELTTLGPSTATLMTEALVIYNLLVLPRMVIKGLACQVTVVGTAGSVARLGMYNPISPNRPKPGKLLLDASTVNTQASTGKKTASFTPFLFPGGLVYVTAVQQGAAATTATLRTNNGVVVPQLHPVSTDINDRYWTEAGVSGALPATATPVAGANVGAAPQIVVIAGDISDLRP